jgi:hypothetical protein
MTHLAPSPARAAGRAQPALAGAAQPALATAARDLEGFQRAMERLFVSLVDRLGGASSRIAGLLDRIEALRTSGRSAFVQVAVAATQELAATFRTETREVQGLSAGLGVAIADVRETERQIASILARTVALSRGLRLSGLNCTTLVLRAGAQEAGFVALSRALSERAELVIHAASQVGTTFARVHDAATAIGDLNGALAGADREELSLSSPIAELFAMLDAVFDSLGQVVDRVRAVQDAIGRIMLVVQKQDILRQQIDHVALALAELRPDAPAAAGEAGRSQQLVFEQRVAMLSAALLAGCKRELDRLVHDTAAAVAELDATTALLARMEQQFCAAIEERLASPVRALEDIHGALVRQLQTCAQYSGRARELQELTEVLRREMGGISEATRGTRVIHTMMRVEIARSGRLEGARALMDDLQARTDALDGLLAEAGKVLSELARNVVRTAGTLDGIDAVNQRFADVGELIRDHPRKVLQCGRALVAALAEIARLGEDNRVALAGVDREFTELGRAAELLERLTRASEAAAASAEERIAAMRVAGAFVDPGDTLHGRLEAIIARFTVLSDKATGGALASVSVEPGDDAGTLTLF